MTEIYAETSAPNAELIAATRLRGLAREALRENITDFDAACGQFRDQVEADPELILALIGVDEWRRIVRHFVQKVQLSEIGKTLRRGNGRVEPDDIDAQRRAKLRAAAEEAHSVLYSFVIAGKPLAVCTRAEVEREARNSSRRAKFLSAIVSELPEVPHVVVRDALTAARADALWRAAGATA